MLNPMEITRETFFYGVLVFLVILALINFVQYAIVYNNLDEFKTNPLKISVVHGYEQNVRIHDYWKNLGGDRIPAVKSVIALAAVAAPFVGAAVLTYLSMNWYDGATKSGLFGPRQLLTPNTSAREY